jgi:uncharacterized protein YbaP (TraB family)
MSSFGFRARVLFLLSVGVFACVAGRAEAASVWKVSAPNGRTLYVGGSVHALRSIDYPLPAAFNRAFDDSSRIVFEVDEKALTASGKALMKAGEYPKGDSLKNNVDPRTYDYVRRVFTLMKVPEAKFSRYRPWFLVLMLQSSGAHGFSGSLGVDQFLLNRAKANKKPVLGLETVREHAEVFSGLSDRQSELLLLHAFVPQEEGKKKFGWLEAWRRGDVDALARTMHENYRDFPAFGVRILDERNRRWMPKIEGYLSSGQTHFVVVGAGHLGGRAGVLTMLRARGYQVTQL